LSSLDKINRRAIDMLSTIRDWFEKGRTRIVVSGSIGPRNDPAWPAHAQTPMSAGQAQDYHRRQIEIFARAGADMVTAFPLCHADEALGIARAAREAGLPAAIGFAIDAGGRLPDGTPLGAAIEAVDAACNSGPAYYLINGVAPSALLHGLDCGPWLQRLRGVLANGGMAGAAAEKMAAAACADPLWLAANLREWMTQLPWLSVVGGCAGDERHIEAICEACLSTRARQQDVWRRPPPRPGLGLGHGMAYQPPR
jgi:homocysteine S-methyltransferase